MKDVLTPAPVSETRFLRLSLLNIHKTEECVTRYTQKDDDEGSLWRLFADGG